MKLHTGVHNNQDASGESEISVQLVEMLSLYQPYGSSNFDDASHVFRIKIPDLLST